MKANETPVKKFAVKCFSPIAEKFVDHATKCFHETRESAMTLIKSFRCVKWQLETWSDSHQKWAVIKSGNASQEN